MHYNEKCMNRFKILHLEDNPLDAELVHHCLRKANLNYEIKVVDNKADFQTSLNYFNPDIILSDHTLPQFNSAEALKIVKAEKSSADIPFILVTGTVSEEFGPVAERDLAGNKTKRSRRKA
jgi:CheY-like chemotaxis protein